MTCARASPSAAHGLHEKRHHQLHNLVLAEGRKLAGASLVTIPASPVPAHAAVPVPPGQQAPPPAETLSGIPPWDTTAGGGENPITGVAAAAGYLGYDKADSFRRARTRHPIPGETRTLDGRPSWTPAVLREWHAQRNAGKRAPTREADLGDGA